MANWNDVMQFCELANCDAKSKLIIVETYAQDLQVYVYNWYSKNEVQTC